MKIRTNFIPNCSAGVVEIKIDLGKAFDEFKQLGKSLKVTVYDKGFKLLLEKDISSFEELMEIRLKFKDKRIELKNEVGWLTISPDKELITLSHGDMAPKIDHFKYWAPLMQFATYLEFSYLGGAGDELPWKIETEEEIKEYFKEYIKDDPYQVHLKEVEEKRRSEAEFEEWMKKEGKEIELEDL